MEINKKPIPRYRYDNVICDRVIDGDTIDVIIDLGFGIKKKERLRFYGIDAWEVRGAEKRRGREAKDYVLDRLFTMVTEWWGGQAKVVSESVTFSIETYKKGKYGRYLAKIFVGGKCLNDEIVKEGHGVYKSYD